MHFAIGWMMTHFEALDEDASVVASCILTGSPSSWSTTRSKNQSFLTSCIAPIETEFLQRAVMNSAPFCSTKWHLKRESISINTVQVLTDHGIPLGLHLYHYQCVISHGFRECLNTKLALHSNCWTYWSMIAFGSKIHGCFLKQNQRLQCPIWKFLAEGERQLAHWMIARLLEDVPGRKSWSELYISIDKRSGVVENNRK